MQGEVVALDRIRNKIDRILQNAQMLRLRSIKAHCFNSVQAVSSDPAQETEGTATRTFIYCVMKNTEHRTPGLLQGLLTLLRVSTGFCWTPPAAASDRDPTWEPPGA